MLCPFLFRKFFDKIEQHSTKVAKFQHGFVSALKIFTKNFVGQKKIVITHM
jgi:hypothetical protein